MEDQVVALVDERFRLERACEEAYVDDADAYGAIVSRTSERIARLDEILAGIVATSPAGIIAQVRVLNELGRGVYGDDDVYHADDCADRLEASIAAGIRFLAA
jgi:hypothetical protein